MSKHIHFIGTDDVVDAYKKLDIEAFAVFSAKQLLFKNIPENIEAGSAVLTSWLELMEARSWEHLTLKVYEDCSKGIKDNTPCDGSFNFALQENPGGTPGGVNNVILSKLSAIEKRMAEIEEGPEDDSTMGMIGRVLEHPAVMPIVAPLTHRIMDWVLRESTPVATRLSGPSAGKNDDVTISYAVERLKKCTPELGLILSKLADLAEKQPSTFNYYMTVVKGMRV